MNHGAIAILWNAYITAKVYAGGGQIDTMRLLGAADAAQMMVLFKVARTISGDPTVADHYVDQAGYTALAARMWGADPTPPAPANPEPVKAFDDLTDDQRAAVLDAIVKAGPSGVIHLPEGVSPEILQGTLLAKRVASTEETAGLNDDLRVIPVNRQTVRQNEDDGA